jgi:hypothetical protein
MQVEAGGEYYRAGGPVEAGYGVPMPVRPLDLTKHERVTVEILKTGSDPMAAQPAPERFWAWNWKPCSVACSLAGDQDWPPRHL